MEARVQADRKSSMPELVVIGADSVSGLLAEIGKILEDPGLTTHEPGFLKWVSYQSQGQFNRREGTTGFRVAVTAYGEEELRKKLPQVLRMIRERPEDAFHYPAAGIFFGMGAPEGKLAFIFPGQGSQYIGMGAGLAAAYPTARDVWDRLGEMRFAGRSINEVVFPPQAGSKEEYQEQVLRLAGADWTNTCISVAGEAILQLLRAMGVRPDAVAAHSWGDIHCFRAAEIISDVDMIRATRHRGELGVKCPTALRGCILAVYETADRVQATLSEHGLNEAWIANYNAPSVMVLSGVKRDIMKAKEVFEGLGINTHLIPISAAPHCPLAVHVSRDFGKYLEDVVFHEAVCDVYSYIFGRKMENSPDRLKHTLWIQIEKPVRFTRQTEIMYEDGIRTFVEVGPSDVLTQCVGQILAGKPHRAVNMDKRKEDSNLVFLLGVAELVAEGRIRDLGVLWEGYPQPPRSLPDRQINPSQEETAVLKRLDLEFAKIERQRSMKAV